MLSTSQIARPTFIPTTPMTVTRTMPFQSAPSSTSDLAAIYSTYVVRVHTRHGIKTISFDLLAEFFTCTAKKAAEDLGISSRTLIRVCRSLGIRRWPYLGFRSEKNVERIRHEAIENLRRKLEKETPDTSAPIIHSTASCLRGASAKRLLQVKTPLTSVAKPPRVCTDMRFARGMPTTMMQPTGAPTPLLTPPAAHGGFHLDIASISPKCTLPQLQPPTMLPIYSSARPKVVSSPEPMMVDSEGSSSLDSHSAIPSLNVLVDASILTAFKREMETKVAQQAHQARTMSMRDILAHTPRAA